jgi:hypothetical protein
VLPGILPAVITSAFDIEKQNQFKNLSGYQFVLVSVPNHIRRTLHPNAMHLQGSIVYDYCRVNVGLGILLQGAMCVIVFFFIDRETRQRQRKNHRCPVVFSLII